MLEHPGGDQKGDFLMDKIVAQKRCKRCGEQKALSEFQKNNRVESGRGSYCMACERERKKKYYAENLEKEKARMRKWAKNNPEKRREINRASNKKDPEKAREERLRASYGLTPLDYEEMLRSQNGVCAVCDSDNNGKRLVVDHNHKTGKVRRLLCHKCNVAIGYAREDVGILEKIIEYLKMFNQ